MNIESKVAPEEVCVYVCLSVYIEGVKKERGREGGVGSLMGHLQLANKEKIQASPRTQRLLQLLPNRGRLVCEFGQAPLFIFKN